MPALIFVILIAVLFVGVPGSIFIPMMIWGLIMSPIAGPIVRICRALGLEGNWAISITIAISLFPFAILALWSAWKCSRVSPERLSHYFNFFILAVGIPAAVMIGLAVTHVPS